MVLRSLLEMLEKLEATACKEPPVLGRAIPWKQVDGQFLRVRWCVFLASIQDGTVEPDPMGSYAALGVECPTLTGQAFIVVSSEGDFRHLWELYKERLVAGDEEVLLIHVPGDERRLTRLLLLPCLSILVYPKGHYREAYDPEFRTLDWAAWNKERARWKPSELGIRRFCVPQQPLEESQTLLTSCLQTDTVLASALALEAEQAVELQTLPIQGPQAPTTRSSKKAARR